MGKWRNKRKKEEKGRENIAGQAAASEGLDGVESSRH